MPVYTRIKPILGWISEILEMIDICKRYLVLPLVLNRI